MSAQFRMSDETLGAYRELRFDQNAQRHGFMIPLGLVLWEDEYPGKLPFAVDDQDARDTMLRVHAARWHYWMDEVIPDDFTTVWNQAQELMPDWPGFQRLYVDEETKILAQNCRDNEKQFWEACMSDADEVDVVDDGDGLSSVSITYKLDKEDRDPSWWTRIKNWFGLKVTSKTK